MVKAESAKNTNCPCLSFAKKRCFTRKNSLNSCRTKIAGNNKASPRTLKNADYFSRRAASVNSAAKFSAMAFPRPKRSKSFEYTTSFGRELRTD